MNYSIELILTVEEVRESYLFLIPNQNSSQLGYLKKLGVIVPILLIFILNIRSLPLVLLWLLIAIFWYFSMAEKFYLKKILKIINTKGLAEEYIEHYNGTQFLFEDNGVYLNQGFLSYGEIQTIKELETTIIMTFENGIWFILSKKSIEREVSTKKFIQEINDRINQYKTAY